MGLGPIYSEAWRVPVLEEEIKKLKEALSEYADHQSWRCTYRSRYGECCCGLDETMLSLRLEPVAVQDPEGKEEG